MVERFNGRLARLLRTHHFENFMDLETTLHGYVSLYNEQLPQKSLNDLTPLQALKNWQDSHPELFQKEVRNRTEPDTLLERDLGDPERSADPPLDPLSGTGEGGRQGCGSAPSHPLPAPSRRQRQAEEHHQGLVQPD